MPGQPPAPLVAGLQHGVHGLPVDWTADVDVHGCGLVEVKQWCV